MSAAPTLHVTDLLDKTRVSLELDRSSKSEMISALVDLLAGHAVVSDLEEIRRAVFRREAEMSTGVGKGIALPHAKTSGVAEMIGALAVLRRPVEFDSMDGEPVRILFLLVARDDAGSQHVRILSRISRLLNRDTVRRALISSTTSDEVLSVLHINESRLRLS